MRSPFRKILDLRQVLVIRILRPQSGLVLQSDAVNRSICHSKLVQMRCLGGGYGAARSEVNHAPAMHHLYALTCNCLCCLLYEKFVDLINADHRYNQQKVRFNGGGKQVCTRAV